MTDEERSFLVVQRLRLLADPHLPAPVGELWNIMDEAANLLVKKATEIERLRAVLGKIMIATDVGGSYATPAIYNTAEQALRVHA